MKHMKKLASLLLALVMVMSLATTAFATQEGELTNGSITINNAVKDQTYSVYQILYLESYSTDDDGNATGAYAYKANSAWESWLKTQTSYVSFDEGYVTWVAATDDATVAAFAKAALAQAKTGNISSDADAITATTSEVKFENLKLGYYLVDSTLGTLCSLDTTNPSVTIQEKNVAPGNEKKVEEDSTSTYGSTNDADIGQTVNFQSTITAQVGAENYVFHDKMSTGLTYGSVTGITLNGTTVATSNYEVKTQAADLEDTNPCTFHVVFTQDFCDTLKANDQIVISYTATVNENATVGGAGNTNESKVSYGDQTKTTTTPASTTTTYTWSVNVFKYTEGEENEEGKKLEVALSGATFTLSKNSDGTTPIALIRVEDDEDKATNTYRVAKTGETGTVSEITTDATGEFTINGLDSDTYYLTETAAPAGYNKLAGPIKIVIAGTDATNDQGQSTKGTVTYYNYDASSTDPYNDTPSGTGKIKVLNQTGAELPSTGGIGTTIFYVLGGILVVGAGVLLVTKKRMSDAR